MNNLQQRLASLYDSYGYRRYKMNKFEQYDLYARNKDFLLSEQVITFTDTNGQLMALKPDVTLSIIKNGKDGQGVQKVYYNEKVYRPAASGGVFREIDQMGLECIGSIDAYAISEVLSLAAKSLMEITKESVLVISHLGVAEAVLECFDAGKRQAAMRALSEKNGQELSRMCPDKAEVLSALAGLYGSPADVIEKLSPMLSGKAKEALSELEDILSTFEGTPVEKILRLDFSVAVGAKYYGGIAFEGFVEGIPERVLSGGCYDKLMAKMGRSSSALGFALYLDLLSRLEVGDGGKEETLLRYPADLPLKTIHEKAEQLRRAGQQVRVAPLGTETDGYARIIDLGV